MNTHIFKGRSGKTYHRTNGQFASKNEIMAVKKIYTYIQWQRNKKKFVLNRLPLWDKIEDRKRVLEDIEKEKLERERVKFEKEYKNEVRGKSFISKPTKRKINISDITPKFKTKKPITHFIMETFRWIYTDISTHPDTVMFAERGQIGYDVAEMHRQGGSASHRGKPIGIQAMAQRANFLSVGREWHKDPYTVGSFTYRIKILIPHMVKGRSREEGTVYYEVEKRAREPYAPLGV